MGQNSKARRMQKIKKTANKKRPVQVKEVVSGLDGLTYTKFDNIFASMSDEVRSEMIDSLGEKARVDLIDQVKQLQAIIRQYHPLQFLSHIATYALTSGVNDDGVTSTDFSSSLGQAQAELLQAISLATLPSDSGYSLINATTIKEVHDLLVNISRNFSLSRYNSAHIEFS
ncbi:hypothetical protein EJP617_17280 [Erwinia sp. Ejp617]|nr:hypothetical protein [Erwinia sp. Ejp617]ADP11409.1 hypothetical protein EJP617_17280 [Erwinia sp. Ejp617]